MKTSFLELQKLFKLKDHSFRQLRAGLVNKIKIIDKNDIEVADDKLQIILKEFKQGQVFDIKEASEFYGVSNHILTSLERLGIISSFRLLLTKGSKILFLKSELDKEHDIIMIHSKTALPSLIRLREITRKLLFYIITDDSPYLEKRATLFLDYHAGSATLDQLGEETGVTSERIRQYFQRIHIHLINKVRYFVSYKNSNEDYRNKYLDLLTQYEQKQSECEHLRSIIANNIKIDILPDNTLPSFIINKQFQDMDLRVRVLNVLRIKKINTIGDLITILWDCGFAGLLRERNFGIGSYNELICYLSNEYKIEYKNRKWHHNNKILAAPPIPVFQTLA